MSTDFHTPHPSGANLDAAVFNTVYSDLDAAIRKGGAVVSATDDPTAGDDVNDGYLVGTLWVNRARDRVWQCVDNTASDASWALVAGEVYCEVYNNANQAIADSTSTGIVFNTEISDDDGMFPGSGDTFTVPFDGLYMINPHIRWESNATGIRDLRVFDGTITRYMTFNAVSGNITRQNLVTLMDLAANDTFEAQVFQDSGVSLNLTNEATNAPSMAISLIQGYINRK